MVYLCIDEIYMIVCFLHSVCILIFVVIFAILDACIHAWINIYIYV